MAAEYSRCSLDIPKEVLAFLASFSHSECVQPLWTFARHGHGYSLKLFWKTNVSPPNNAHSSSRRNDRSRQRMEAFIAKKKALNSRDDDTLTGIPCPDVSDNLSPGSSGTPSSLDSKATTVTAQARPINLHKGTPTLSSSVPSVSTFSLQVPGCEASQCLGAAKSNPSDSPVAKHTRSQCAAKSDLQVVNPHDQVQSLTSDCPARPSFPQLNLPESLSNVVTKYHAVDAKMGSLLVR